MQKKIPGTVSVIRAKQFKKPRLINTPVQIAPDDLKETMQYVGCYCIYQGQIGLSFKGLESPIAIQLLKKKIEVQPNTFLPVELPAHYIDILQSLLLLRDRHQVVLHLERTGCDDDALDHHRQLLNLSFDEVVAECGSLRGAISLFEIDNVPDVRLASLWALEGRDGSKAAILLGRVIDPIPNLDERIYEELDDEGLENAIARSINYFGRLNVGAIALWFGVSEEAVEARLVESGFAFKEPILGEKK